MHAALYLLLFPQLIAGPIIRYRDIADQLARRLVTVDDFGYGVRRFIVGLAKKVLVANVVAGPADRIFGMPVAELSTGHAWLGLTCYTLQIYFDFSGYSDMAIGLGRMFGFRFPENFRWPYIADSVQEFWRRWHISLSTWFRDYLYIPLGGNRVSPARRYCNLVTVFFLCGLWHGASWNFVIWGLWHGTFLVIERVTSNRGERGARRKTFVSANSASSAVRRGVLDWPLWRHAYTMLVVMIGWVFFRADTLPGAMAFLRAMAGLSATAPTIYTLRWYLTPELWLTLDGWRDRFDTVGGCARATACARRAGAVRLASVARQHHRACRAARRVDRVDRRAHLQPVHLLPILMNRALTALFVVIISLPLAANLAGVDGADPGAETANSRLPHRELATWKDGRHRLVRRSLRVQVGAGALVRREPPVLVRRLAIAGRDRRARRLVLLRGRQGGRGLRERGAAGRRGDRELARSGAPRAELAAGPGNRLRLHHRA